MNIDPDDVFRDDDDVDGPDNELYQERDATKEMLVYLVDASPKMFSVTCPSEDKNATTHFEVAVRSIAQSLKTQIINRTYDEVAMCFFNTRKKKNLQDLNGVYVFSVPDREDLDRPTARLIKEFDCIEESFSKHIGSKYGILSDTRDNSLYNAIWAAQALLRKGSIKTVDKRILLFTNEDNPFGNIKGAIKVDMIRTTLQRAKVISRACTSYSRVMNPQTRDLNYVQTSSVFCHQTLKENKKWICLFNFYLFFQDAQDLGISIELLPLTRPDDDFNVSTFYAELLCLEDSALAEFKALAGERFEDMKDQLRKRMFRKRKVRRINFIIAGGLSIELNTYALVRPTNPGVITWLDSVTNLPLKAERSLLCSDTGAVLQEPPKLFQTYKNGNILFTSDEISEIKRVSTGHIHLLGFKPLICLKDYHNLRPSTFVFPSDEEVIGSTCIFIALHRSMMRLERFAVAFYGNPTHPQLVALVAQDEIVSSSGQIEPPGMHMIYLPYCDDIRPIEELHIDTNPTTLEATEDQIKSASSLVKFVDLKNFSVCQFANPALQRHYAVLQALALDEDDMPDIKDETLPDEEGLARPGIVKALEEFKLSVYGENMEQEDDLDGGKTTEASKKRKAIADNAKMEYANYDWSDLADNGKLKELTVAELKYYLAAHSLPVTGKKEALISRILTHMGK